MTIDHSVMLREGTELLGGIYRIERQIASGGFGNTYVVTDTQLDERYALKEFFMRGINERRDGQTTVTVTGQQNRPQFEAQREKFKKEARRLSKLGNTAQPNRHIVKVKLLFEANDTAYYVMEYVDGESLSQRLKLTGKPLAEAEALDIVRQVLDGLAAVHAQQIWHLDLKPANILIERQTGRAVIIDFGASKQLSPTDGYTTTASAMAYTQGYAPAEQMEQDINRIGPWTDLYALGATLYNLLTGHTPPTLSAMLSGQAFRFPADVSAKTQHLVRWLMAPNPIQRPQSVKEVHDFLARPFTAESVDAAETEQTVLGPVQTTDTKDSVAENATDPAQHVDDGDREKTVLNNPEPPSPKPTPRWKSMTPFIASALVGMVVLTVAFIALRHTRGEVLPNSENNVMVTESVNDVQIPSETFTVNGVSFKMTCVEGGTFTMGATSEQGSEAGYNEKPAHQVKLSSYSIGETEVTQALWEAVMSSNPSRFKGSDRPVENVSWKDCQTFINRLTSLTGRIFRLPTEAEWEYAARGGNKSRGYKYSGSDDIGDVAWYDDNSNDTHRVKTKRANELGLYDMSGNVWEWCQDWYGSYGSSSQRNPRGASSGSDRVYRGGGWDDNARRCRVSYRNNWPPGNRSYLLGLRLAL